MVDFQKLSEWLNDCITDKKIILVGKYEGDYYIGNEEFKRIRNNPKDIEGEDIEKNYRYTYEIEKVLEMAVKKEYGK